MYRVSGHLRKNVVICKNYFTRVIFVEKWPFKKIFEIHIFFRSLEKRRHKWRWRSILRRVHWCNCSTENNKLLKIIINYLFTASNKTGYRQVRKGGHFRFRFAELLVTAIKQNNFFDN